MAVFVTDLGSDLEPQRWPVLFFADAIHEELFKAVAENQPSLAKAPTEVVVVPEPAVELEVGDSSGSSTGAQGAYALELAEEAMLSLTRRECSISVGRAHGDRTSPYGNDRLACFAGTCGL